MAWQPEVIKRGPLPPKAPTEGLGWRDSDSRDLYVWAEGRGWIAAEAYEPPHAAPVAIEPEPPAEQPPEPEPAAVPPAAPALGEITPSLRRASPRPSVETLCGDCGRPRSPSSGRRCRHCYLAEAARRREWRMIAGLIDALRRAIEATPPPAPPPLPPPAPPPPPPRPPAAPPPPPAREPVPAAPPREREETHPILARHAREIERGRPIDPRGTAPRRRKPAPEPEFSDEFKAQLARVAAGAGIVEVARVRSADPEGVLGSSLGFEV